MDDKTNVSKYMGSQNSTDLGAKGNRTIVKTALLGD